MSEHKEGRPEWYKRLEQDDEFPGRTFTADSMDRIERRAVSSEAARRSWRLRLGAMGAVACVIGLALWLVIAGPLGGGGASDKGPLGATREPFPAGQVPEPVPTASSDPQPTPTQSQEVQLVYYLKGDVHATLSQAPFSSGASFEGTTMDTYTVPVTVDNEFAKLVDKEGRSGWIPIWYLVGAEDTGERVQKLGEPYVMLVDKPVAYRLYPGELKPSGLELWTGKVVQIVGTYEDWVEINMVTYDSPYAENKWVRKDELIPYEDGKAKEGFAYPPNKPAVTLYTETGEANQELWPLTPIYIKGEQGDRYSIIAAGGISGYMDKKDFMPNPFSIQVIDQAGEAGAAQ